MNKTIIPKTMVIISGSSLFLAAVIFCIYCFKINTQKSPENKEQNVSTISNEQTLSQTQKDAQNIILTTPSKGFIRNDTTTVRFEIINCSLLSTESIPLFCNGEKIAELNDKAENGDYIENDGTFATYVEIHSTEDDYTFWVEAGDKKSNEITIHTFEPITEEDVKKCDEILEQLSQFNNYCSTLAEAYEEREKVYKYLLGLQEKGEIIDVEEGDTCVFFQLKSGINCIFDIEVEGFL